MRNRLRPYQPTALAVTALISIITSIVFLVSAEQTTNQLTGNWAVKTPLGDGTFRTTYLNLKQDGSKITGSIRVTQFYYLITESSAGPDGFTLTGSMLDGKNARTVRYE